ncbi:MAG TPA: hypothetical protein VFX20_18235 [Steroidobacteraceae bacterium]|nr:hypothetical protein [Steroidobacteraceae bacterium]
MSQNDQPAPGEQQPPTLGEQLAKSLQAHAAEILRSCRQVDQHGNEQMMVPIAQLLIDVRTLEVKLQCIFEELGKEQLIDPEKLMHRTIRKFEFEARQLKQANDARPNLAIAQHIGSINGRGHG